MANPNIEAWKAADKVATEAEDRAGDAYEAFREGTIDFDDYQTARQAASKARAEVNDVFLPKILEDPEALAEIAAEVAARGNPELPDELYA